MYNGGVIGVRRNRDQVENVDGRQAFEAIIIADYDARSISEFKIATSPGIPA
jgi:hypothetical protein